MSSLPPSTVPPAPPPPPGGGSYTPPPPPPPGAPRPADSDRTIMLVLSYAWFLSLIPLFVKKDDRDVQWHAKNGLVMAIAITAVDIIFWILGRFFPVFTCLISFVPCIIFIAYVVVQIIAIMKAVNGQRLRVPMLSDFADKI